jgi:hypothetical protein
MWISVDPVGRDSTLEFIAGSHKGPWLMPRSFMSNEAKWFPEGDLANLPDIEAAREDYPILGWEVEPGDVVCFHMLTLHASAGVPSTGPRRVFSVRFLGDDITHAPRRWATSPEFPGLTDDLPPGAPMDHSLFPVVWNGPEHKDDLHSGGLKGSSEQSIPVVWSRAWIAKSAKKCRKGRKETLHNPDTILVDYAPRNENFVLVGLVKQRS